MLLPGSILQGRYLIVRLLNQGGMGAVYEAIDQRLRTTVALKECFFNEERLRRQFEREALLLARMRHPAMTRVIDHFTEEDGQFLVMEFISGDDLAEMLIERGEPFPIDQALNWLAQLLDALDYLHSQLPQIIHRDIKPHNLKLTPQGQIILLDFGLAKGFSAEASKHIVTGSIRGYTPAYAPLEQIQGSGTNPRTDLYSLAATVYHLMTGEIPIDAVTRAASILNGEPDPLAPANEINSQVPPEIADVLARAMSLKDGQRPASAAQMRQALENSMRFSAGGRSKKTDEAAPSQAPATPYPQGINPREPTTVLASSSPPPASSMIAEKPLPAKNHGTKPQSRDGAASAFPMQPVMRSARAARRRQWVITGSVVLLTSIALFVFFYYNFSLRTTKFPPFQLTAPYREGVVDRSDINLRSVPHINGDILAVLPRGSRVRILESSGGWSRVEVMEWNGGKPEGAPDGGWVVSELVKLD